MSSASPSISDDKSPVKATITLRQNFKMVVDQDDREQFEEGFMSELASFLGVDTSRVRILGVREGVPP